MCLVWQRVYRRARTTHLAPLNYHHIWSSLWKQSIPVFVDAFIGLEPPILSLHEVFKVDAFYVKMLTNIGNLGRILFVCLLSNNNRTLKSGLCDYKWIGDGTPT